MSIKNISEHQLRDCSHNLLFLATENVNDKKFYVYKRVEKLLQIRNYYNSKWGPGKRIRVTKRDINIFECSAENAFSLLLDIIIEYTRLKNFPFSLILERIAIIQ